MNEIYQKKKKTFRQNRLKVFGLSKYIFQTSLHRGVKCSNYVLNIKLDVIGMVDFWNSYRAIDGWMNWCFEGEVNDLMLRLLKSGISL